MKTHYTGWIKPGEHGREIINGHEYITIYNWWQRIIQRIVKPIQKALWLCGIAVHDPVFGECTPDFNCCCNIGRRAFIRISDRRESK